METKAMLSWLHIADLQMGSKGSDSDALLKDVESQLQATGVRPDFVAVTGDVARSGQWKHYQLAAEFFDSLLKRIDAAKDRLFIVPGNHDIDKRQVALGKGSGDDPKTSIIAPDRFVLDNYARFIDEYLGESMRLDASRYAYLRRLDWGGRKVAVAGLNTAAVGPPLHPSAPKDLISDFEDQARSVLDQMGEDDVSIALLHHSLDSLPHQRGYGSIHAWLQRCDFVLCAHTHSGDVLRVIQSNGRALTIQGGSDPSFSQHPNAYNFVELDPGRGVCRVHFRQYDPGRRAWQEDFRAHPKAVDGIYTFQLPERLRTHPKSEPKEGYSPPLAGYTPDIVTGDDKLGIMSEVEAFSSVIAYKGLRPPLCLGVFGDWGSGKT
ncbi:MAG: metallophosphoesterase, partial [Desulfobacterales bacterium]